MKEKTAKRSVVKEKGGEEDSPVRWRSQSYTSVRYRILTSLYPVAWRRTDAPV